jgi:hypothetical protein
MNALDDAPEDPVTAAHPSAPITLNPQFYPLITDTIISYLGVHELLPFLNTSRFLRAKAIPHLLRHIVVAPKDKSSRPKLYLPTWPKLRLPDFEWEIVKSSVKVLDVSPTAREVEVWPSALKSLEQVALVRDHSRVYSPGYLPDIPCREWVLVAGWTWDEIPLTVKEKIIFIMGELPGPHWTPVLPQQPINITFIFQGRWLQYTGLPDYAGDVDGWGCLPYYKSFCYDDNCAVCQDVQRIAGSVFEKMIRLISKRISRRPLPADRGHTITIVNCEDFLGLVFPFHRALDDVDLREQLWLHVAKTLAWEVEDVAKHVKIQSTEQFRNHIGADKFKLYMKRGYPSINQ